MHSYSLDYDFIRFANQLAALNVSGDTLYAALLADAESQPPDWDLQGRQVNIWKTLGTPLHDAYYAPSS
jgi:hypothetical protein